MIFSKSKRNNELNSSDAENGGNRGGYTEDSYTPGNFIVFDTFCFQNPNPGTGKTFSINYYSSIDYCKLLLQIILRDCKKGCMDVSILSASQYFYSRAIMLGPQVPLMVL
jgi:hypothetical protein